MRVSKIGVAPCLILSMLFYFYDMQSRPVSFFFLCPIQGILASFLFVINKATAALANIQGT